MRKTIADLRNGVYQYDEHANLSDRGARRYHSFSFDFDSTPTSLNDPEEHWDEQAKQLHLENRERAVERLKHSHGTLRIDNIIRDTSDLGSMSLLTYHNSLHEQARCAFVTGLYYPALVAACALGERILNHLLLDLRDSFRDSPHYKRIHRKKSFDDWPFAISVLTDWKVLADGVGEEFVALAVLRNRSIHFDPDTYRLLREDARAALHLLNRIIAKQFGYFGSQPWFIDGTPGAQFVKRVYENDPFVRAYIIPRSGFIGPLYGMERSTEGHWFHLDYANYGDEELTDEDYARRYRERDHAKVVTREMIEKQCGERIRVVVGVRCRLQDASGAHR